MKFTKSVKDDQMFFVRNDDGNILAAYSTERHMVDLELLIVEQGKVGDGWVGVIYEGWKITDVFGSKESIRNYFRKVFDNDRP